MLLKETTFNRAAGGVKASPDLLQLQYYVISPAERARLKALLAPLDARQLEKQFKTMMNHFFMAEPNRIEILGRVRFCAFKNALALVRATDGGGVTLAPADPRIPAYGRRLGRAKDILIKYKEAHSRYTALYETLPADDLDPDIENYTAPKKQSLGEAFRALHQIDLLKKMRQRVLPQTKKNIADSIHPCALHAVGLPSGKERIPFEQILARYDDAKEMLWKDAKYRTMRKELGLPHYKEPGPEESANPGIVRRLTQRLTGPRPSV